MEDKKHFICLGDCENMSQNPGVCQDTNCDNYNQELTPCSCEDGGHDELKLDEEENLDD